MLVFDLLGAGIPRPAGGSPIANHVPLRERLEVLKGKVRLKPRREVAKATESRHNEVLYRVREVIARRIALFKKRLLLLSEHFIKAALGLINRENLPIHVSDTRHRALDNRHQIGVGRLDAEFRAIEPLQFCHNAALCRFHKRDGTRHR